MVLPVFGMVLGNDKQAGFVAYATSADETMKVIAMPHNNTTWYNFAYAEFSYNETYYQETNNSGDGYTTLSDSPNESNIKIQYQFLAGDGTNDSYPASYVGMARAYRDYLLKNELISNSEIVNDSDIPLRIDFLMADVKKDLFGYEDVVVTTLKDIEEIYQRLYESGLTNINSGLLGYTAGGVTAGEVMDSKISSKIGGKSDMLSLLELANTLEYDVSLYTDYINITELQSSSLFTPTPAKHISGRYMVNQIVDYQTINEYYFARFDKSIKWLQNDVTYTENLGMKSITIDGLSNTLYSEYQRDVSRYDNMQLVISELQKISLGIDAVNPNAYLLPYVNRYLEAPLYSTQYLIETDTVPFLQLVLYGTMELYSNYANFNITLYNDILRMIDYNVYPSFVLTKEPSYKLIDTNSFLFYSTQFSFYEEEIPSVYNEVNNALHNVIGLEWINRIVLEDGVIMNEYSGGVSIIINYNDTDYNGVINVSPNSYEVIENG